MVVLKQRGSQAGWLCQMSGGVLARLRPDLSIGVALAPPGGNLWGSGSPGAWHARAAGATMRGWLVMTAGPRCS